MRPIAVLILVLGAFAALFFALFSGGERRLPQESLRGPGVQSVAEAPPEDELSSPRQQAAAIPLAEAGTSREAEGLPTDPGSSFTGFITGQVVDSDDYLVPDATVKLIQIPVGGLITEGSLTIIGNERAKDPITSVQSLPNGEFAIDGVQASTRWALVVSHANYSTLTVGPLTVPETGGLARQRIVLVPGNTLRGFVRAKGSGVAIPGAVLTMTSPVSAFSKTKSGKIEVSTDEQGSYSFSNTDRTVKTLIVRAPGFATTILNNFYAVPFDKTQTSREPFDALGNPINLAQRQDTKVITREFDIELEPGMSIAGRVMAPSGKGVKGVTIQAYCLTKDRGSHGTAVSVGDGEFLLSDLAEGQYSISASARGYQCLPIQRVEAGSTDLTIELIEQGSVSGRVLKDDTGRPLSKFSCTIRSVYTNNLAAGEAVTTKNFSDSRSGAFRIDGISAGEYVAEVKARGLASSFSAPFHVVQGELTSDVTIRVTEGGSLQGAIIDQRTGAPLAGATITIDENNHVDSPLFNALSNMTRSATTRAKVVTKEDGTFELKLMTPDTYQLLIQKSGFSSITMNNVKVGDGEETVLETIALKAGALVEGQVIDLDGSPVPGAHVMLIAKDKKNHWAARNTSTDADGRYVIRNVAAGDYELSSSRPPKPGASFLGAALDMKKSSMAVQLEEGNFYTFDLEFIKRNKKKR